MYKYGKENNNKNTFLHKQHCLLDLLSARYFYNNAEQHCWDRFSLHNRDKVPRLQHKTDKLQIVGRQLPNLIVERLPYKAKKINDYINISF